MKLSELRIGNYVDGFKYLVKNEDDGSLIVNHSRIFNVDLCGSVYVQKSHEFGAEYSVFPIQHPRPIPITKDWLLRFGFNGDYIPLNVNEPSCNDGLTKKVDISYQDSILEVWFFEEDKDGNNDYECLAIKFRHIKYVHQLQNLYFILTNEELIIKK